MTSLKNKLVLLIFLGALLSDSFLISAAYEQGYQSNLQLKREVEAKKKTVFRRRLLAACGITALVILGAIFLVKRNKAPVAPTTVAGTPADSILITVLPGVGPKSDDEAEEVDCRDGANPFPARLSDLPREQQNRVVKWLPEEIRESFISQNCNGAWMLYYSGGKGLRINCSNLERPQIMCGGSFVDVKHGGVIKVKGVEYYWNESVKIFAKERPAARAPVLPDARILPQNLFDLSLDQKAQVKQWFPEELWISIISEKVDQDWLLVFPSGASLLVKRSNPERPQIKHRGTHDFVDVKSGDFFGLNGVEYQWSEESKKFIRYQPSYEL